MIFPLVTIAIPTYNQPSYLEKAIISVIEQTYPYKEIIVSEDSDNKETLININLLKTKYPQVAFYINTARLGRVENYKKILTSYSTGDLYINLDADDYFTNCNFIKNAVNEITKIKIDNFLFYQGANVYKTIDHERIISNKLTADETVMTGISFISRFFKIGHFSHMATLYNRNLALKSGFYDTDIISADIFSFLKLTVNNPEKKVILSKEVAGVWLQHETNASKSLGFKLHYQNFGLYKKIFLLQYESQHFSHLSAIYWFFEATFYYWGIYLKNIVVKTFINK